MELGQTIRSLRRQAGLTQQQLAERLNVTNNYVCLVEKGKRTPSVRLLEALAEQLNIPVSQLLWDAAEVPANLSAFERRLYERLREASIALFALAKELEEIRKKSSEQ